MMDAAKFREYFGQCPVDETLSVYKEIANLRAYGMSIVNQHH